MTYNEAKAKATARRKGLDFVLDYEDAYVFYNSREKKEGMDDNEVVVLKSSGNIVSFSDYIVNTKSNKKPIKRMI